MALEMVLVIPKRMGKFIGTIYLKMNNSKKGARVGVMCLVGIPQLDQELKISARKRDRWLMVKAEHLKKEHPRTTK